MNSLIPFLLMLLLHFMQPCMPMAFELRMSQISNSQISKNEEGASGGPSTPQDTMNQNVAGTVSKLEEQGERLAVQVGSLNSENEKLKTANARIDETLKILKKKEKRDVKKWFKDIDDDTLRENIESLMIGLVTMGPIMAKKDYKIKFLEKQLANDIHPNEKSKDLQRKLNVEKSKIKKTEIKLRELKQKLSGDVYEAEDKGKNNLQSLVSMLRSIEYMSRIVPGIESEVQNIEQQLSSPNEKNEEKRKHLQRKLIADKSTLKTVDEKIRHAVRNPLSYTYEAENASTLKVLELMGLKVITTQKGVENIERLLSNKSEINRMPIQNVKMWQEILEGAKHEFKKMEEVLQEVKQELEGYEAENNDRMSLDSMIKLIADIGQLARKEFQKGNYLVKKLLELSKTDDPEDRNGEREELLRKLRTVESILNRAVVEIEEQDQMLRE